MARLVRRSLPVLRTALCVLAALLMLFGMRGPIQSAGQTYDSASPSTIAWKACTPHNIANHGITYPVPSYSPDGSKIVSICGFNTVMVYDLATDKYQLLEGHTDKVQCVAYSGDGNWVASGGNDKQIILWNAKNKYARTTTISANGMVTSLNFSANGSKMTALESSSIRVWDTTTWTTTTMAGLFNSPTEVVISPDGRKVAACSYDNKKISVWDTSTALVLNTMDLPFGVAHLAWAPNSTDLAFSYGTNYLEVRDAVTGQVKVPAISGIAINSLAYSPNGQTLAVFLIEQGTGLRGIRLYSSTGTLQRWISTNMNFGGTYSPDGSRLACGNGLIHLYSSANGQLMKVITGDTAAVHDVAVSADSKYVFSSDQAGLISQWNTDDGALVRTLNMGIGDPIYCVATSPDGKLMAGTAKNTVMVWQAATGALYRTYTTGSDASVTVSRLAFSPDNSSLLGGCVDQKARIWNLSVNGQTPLVFTGGPIANSMMYGIGYLPNGNIFVGCADGKVLIYQPNGTNLVTTTLPGPARCYAISPDGSMIAAGMYDGTITLLRTTNGSIIQTIAAGLLFTYGVGFSADGAVVVGVGENDMIFFFSTITGAKVNSIRKLLYSPKSVVFTPDGSKFIAAGYDGVGAWNLTANSPQPDVLVKISSDTSFVGDHIINITGNKQAVSTDSSPNTPAVFNVKVQNNYSGNDTFTFKGPAGGSGWTVEYYDGPISQTKITDAVVAGTWSTGVLATGASKEIRVEITPDPLMVGMATSVLLTATSQADPTAKDAVKMSTSSPVGPGASMRVSIHTSGAEGDLGSQYPAVSQDGMLVAFQSDATTLVDDDTNVKRDIFVRDRNTGVTTRVSESAGGAQANGDCWAPAMNSNGTSIAYVSDATNLIDGNTDTNNASDIFVVDANGAVERVSVGLAGAEPDGASYSPAISADGNLVVFVSDATNLVANDTNDAADVFLYNRTTKATTRVSVSSKGTQADGASRDATISADGTKVAFSSLATNLVSADSNTSNDIYVKTLASGAITCASLAADGSASNDGSYLPKLSSDGALVAFTSRASNLLANGADTNGKQDVFLCDLVGVAGTNLTQVSYASGAGGNGDSGQYGLDLAVQNGTTYVVFESSARNLISLDDNNKADVYLWERKTGSPASISRMSVSTLGDQANGTSGHPVISADAGAIAFDSLATNLVSDDTNGVYDVFVHLRGAAYQPDLLLSTDGGAASYKGGGLYALSEAQTLDVSTNTTVTTHFYVQLSNSLTNPVATYTLKASGYDATAGWTAKLTDQGNSTDVSMATLTGTGYTVTLDPGATRTFMGTVRTFASSPATPPLELVLTATSVDDVSRKDSVMARVSLVPYQTVLASMTNGAGMGGDDCGFSSDGRFVSFVSGSTIQVHDRVTGITTRVDTTKDGTAANQASADQDISGDGRYVIFKSTASNLVADNINGVQQIFMKDRQTGDVLLVSRANGVNGAPSDTPCDSAVISPNGRYVAYSSSATNLVTVPDMTTNTTGQVYLRDMVAGTTKLLSKNSAGTPENQGSGSCGINSTGTFVTWRTKATNLVDLNGDGLFNATDDVNAEQDVFICDVATGAVEMVSLNKTNLKSGDKASSRDYRSPVSDDGRYVAFSSLATDLIEGQLNGGDKRQIFIRDRAQQKTIELSIGSDDKAASADCDRPTMTLDGRYVGFATTAVLLAAIDTNGKADVYIADRTKTGAAALDLASMPYNYVSTTNTPVNNTTTQDPFISGDGRFISFEGVVNAGDPTTNLVSTNYTGTNGQQIYIRDRWQLAPDLTIRKTGDPTFTGGGTINSSGAGQTLAVTMTGAGAVNSYDIKLTNTGSTTDDITITGTPATAGWTVVYKDSNGVDITSQLIGDGYLAANLASGAAVTLTATVTGDAFLLPGSQYDLLVTAVSGKNVATRDRVKAPVRMRGAAKADLQIRSLADDAFLGNNIYDDGTEQTKTGNVLNGKTMVYVARIENDGGSGDDNFTLFADTLGPNWTLSYRLADGTDITNQITNTGEGGGWKSGSLAMGDYAEIRVIVTPSASLNGGASAVLHISALSGIDNTVGDAVIANTIVTVKHQPDLQMRGPSSVDYIGDGVYDDGTAQTVNEIIQRGTMAQYFVMVQNDGNVTEQLPVIGTAGDANWTIRYYDVTNVPVEVTNLVTAGTWPAAALAMGEVAKLRIDVTPSLALNPGDAKTLTLTAVSEGDVKKTDAVVAITTTAIRKPDLLAKSAADVLYVGDDIYAPAAQAVSASVDNSVIAAYQLQLQNDGNTADVFKLTIPADGNGWTYRVYAGTDTTNEITNLVRAGTWSVSLGAGASQPIYVQVLPDATLYGGTAKTVTIGAASGNEPTYTDAVTLTTTVTVRHQGDALVQGDGDLIYVGGNQYSGTAQTKAQPVRAGKVATFRVKVENDGNVDETFTLLGAKATAGWTVTYLAEGTNTDVTATITGAGLSLPLVKGASATYLIKVMGDATLASGASLPLTVTVKRAATTDDVVTATTQLIGSTARVSVDSLGVQANNDAPGLNSPAAVSQDGRYVVFSSTASNLVAGDTNAVSDIFVHDRVTGTTTRVSVTASGAQANGACDMPVISADGRYVAFRSTATNLVAGDTNNRADVFRVDRITGTVVRVSVNNAGAQALSGDSGAYGIVISADGNLVAFESGASNLASNDTNGVSDIFLRDVNAGTTLRVSATAAGGTANGRSLNPSMSADGRYLVYSSFATNLVVNDLNACSDIFLYDKTFGTTTLVSQLNGVQGNANSDDPSISGDGTTIAYTTLASNLLSGDTNGTWDVVRVARTGGTPTLASMATDGFYGNAASSGPILNYDGRFTAFRSYATNLVAGDTNNRCDAFVFDYASRTVTRASLTGSGAQVNDNSASYGVALDGQGYICVFDSIATNLVPDDTNVHRDVFAREWPAFQPDLLVRLSTETSWLGDGVYYNPDAQTKVGNVQPGGTMVYQLAVQNDGMLTDSYTITQTQAIKANWTIAIYGPDGALIPALATQNGSWIVPVAGGQTKTLRVEMTPGAAILPTYFQELLFTVSSSLMPDRTDAVKIKTLRARVTATLAANPTKVLPGMPVTLTATLNGPATATYSFAAKVKEANGTYTTVVSSTESASNTWVWTPAAPGTYTLCVYVREPFQSATSASYLFNYIVVSPISGVGLSTSLAAPQAAATNNITLTATVAGGLAPEYQFLAAKRDPVTQVLGAYAEIRAFSTNKYATWRPTVAGSYALRVNVREQGTTTVLATGDIASYAIVPILSAVSLTANPASGTVGLPVTLTAAPTGGANPEFRFLCYVADWFGVIHEQEIQAYGSAKTATWTPNVDHVGTVTLTILAREKGSTAAYKVQKSIPYTVAKP